jgi:transposase
MEQVFERCAGLDVHKATVSACVRIPKAGGRRHQEIRTFGTSTNDLLAMRDWLAGYAVTHIAMEATGVYRKPIYYVLEEGFTLLLVNAAHVKQVPGRKSRRGGLRLAGSASGARPVARKLCSAAANSRVVRSHTVSQELDSGPDSRSQPLAQGTSRCRPQALQRRRQRAGCIRPRHAERLDGRSHRP